MTYTEIFHLQKRIGTTPDGFWGPKSIRACKEYLRAMMPEVNPWPKSDQSSLTAFYGHPGDESKLVSIDVANLGVKYDGQTVRSIRCHEKVADSLRRVIVALDETPCAYILGQYAGCYNNRPMRGGSLPSLHARGAAIDLDPAPNGNHRAWPVNATMPILVMEEFAKEGWIGLGWAIGRDAMHFQATQ